MRLLQWRPERRGGEEPMPEHSVEGGKCGRKFLFFRTRANEVWIAVSRL
jgi:hypothetical protein